MSRRLIMFTGPNCAACDTMKPLVEPLNDVEIISVMDQPLLAQTYGIRGGLPVFIKIVDGNFNDRMDGAVSKRVLDKWRNS